MAEINLIPADVIDIVEQSIQDISPDLLKILLSDKTTKKFIRWGSDNYVSYGPEYYADQEMTPNLITGKYTDIIRPRVTKAEEQQTKRTKDNAEVFTPSWLCNEQNNIVDAAWFGRCNVFNVSKDKGWTVVTDSITFPRDRIWKDYVDARRMEVSCGEAPYIVSRYDTVTGCTIPIVERIGLLDRKLRVVGENAINDEEWFDWTARAFQSVYGYDFQGDNVLLARENLFYTFIEYAEERTGVRPTLLQMKKIANIIAWNIWQMNGLTMTSPYSLVEPTYKQMSLFDMFDLAGNGEEQERQIDEISCKIFDWRSNESIEFRSMMKEE